MSVRFQADADLNYAIITATRQREPGIDFLSAADTGLDQAARHGRILITHDRRTMPTHFRQHLDSGKACPGILIVPQHAPLRPVVDSIILIWAASEPHEWRDQIYHLPSLTRRWMVR